MLNNRYKIMICQVAPSQKLMQKTRDKMRKDISDKKTYYHNFYRYAFGALVTVVAAIIALPLLQFNNPAMPPDNSEIVNTFSTSNMPNVQQPAASTELPFSQAPVNTAAPSVQAPVADKSIGAENKADELTLEEAMNNAEFGRFVPKALAGGLKLSTAYLTGVGQSSRLSLNYENGMKYITIFFSHRTELDNRRIVDITKPETYDLTLYPIPRAESVPDDLYEIVNDPVFKADELTLELVKSRAYTVNDSGDDNTGYRMEFSVLFNNDILVRLVVKGAQSEDIWRIVQDMAD